ncbi:hypothetical protein DYB32_007960 [Aphanomyces invadans]|uniref:Uncharacterized protein n=1 Tax=Aphanomyces invadans TaxID=157072 RepID=A0A3R6YZU6_9STRA|nr:hypothetical protein DYB32_007960 [Aphanomyces invadans]
MAITTESCIDESFGGYEVLASYDAPSEPKTNLLLLLSGMNTKTYVGSNAIAINANTSNSYAPLDSKLPLQKGSMAWYPFDMYEVRMFVLVNTSMSPFNGQPQDPVDVSFVIVTPSNFDWNYRIKETYGDTAVAPGVYSITVEIKRQFNVYTALVFAGIWAVTVSIGYIGRCETLVLVMRVA